MPVKVEHFSKKNALQNNNITRSYNIFIVASMQLLKPVELRVIKLKTSNEPMKQSKQVKHIQNMINGKLGVSEFYQKQQQWQILIWS